MVASIIKTVEIKTIIVLADQTKAQVNLLRWLYIEASVVIITSSIPFLRPLFSARWKNFTTSDDFSPNNNNKRRWTPGSNNNMTSSMSGESPPCDESSRQQDNEDNDYVGTGPGGLSRRLDV